MPSHPSTALLEALFRSFQKADGMLESRIVILADGCEEVRPSNEIKTDNSSGDTKHEIENIKHGKCYSKTAENYRNHLRRLERAVRDQNPPFCPHDKGSIELVQLEKRYGSAPAIEVAMKMIVSTPLVMICQHDNFFVHEAPLREIVQALLQEPRGLGIGANCIHFLSTATMNYREKVKRRYKLDLGDPVTVKNLKDPLIPLVFWYGRSHVTYSDYVRSHCLNRRLAPGSHLEELLGEKQLHDILKHGMDIHKTYGTYVLDQGKEVLYHMSGRRVRAAEENDSQNCNNQIISESTNMSQSSTIAQQPLDGSFTTARETRAKVPGLAFFGVEDKLQNMKINSTSRKPFKQRCFHCGEKGHSKKFCPLRVASQLCQQTPEVIEL